MSSEKKEPRLSNGLFVLLLGPSGVGKSTIIKELAKELDITYVTPIMDRPSRPGETEKISLTTEEFTEKEAAGEFLVVNHLYGSRYGTPRQTVEQTLSARRVAVLDFPLSRLAELSQYKERGVLLTIYILPPSREELARRLTLDNRDPQGIRLAEGLTELTSLERSNLSHPDINFFIVNEEASTTARQIKQLILSD